MPAHTHCRICATDLPEPFLDLGAMPLANAFLASSKEFTDEPAYPLAVTCCTECGLVQLNFTVPAEQMFRKYLYVSSTSDAVAQYAKELAAKVVKQHQLSSNSRVVELGSNDGLILKAFQQLGVQVLGVEPAQNIAQLAIQAGIPTMDQFFNETTAQEVAQKQGSADIILGRHVFAHIDDLNDFMRGVSALLAPNGAALIEVPYWGNLLAEHQFDTIYHEHLSYVALEPVETLCRQHKFQLVDVEPVSLHGGSILMTLKRTGVGAPSERLKALLEQESVQALRSPDQHQQFAKSVYQWKESFQSLVTSLKSEGAHIVGYGAAAKANTLLNFCPEVANALEYILDRSSHKVGLFTPGTHLPVTSPEAWQFNGTTHLLILAWNFKEEVMSQMSPFAQKGGKFIVPIPQPMVT